MGGKKRGVFFLSVFAILLIMGLGGLVNASYSCGDLVSGSSKICNGGSTITSSTGISSPQNCESWCESSSSSGGTCCYWDAVNQKCYLTSGSVASAGSQYFAASCSGGATDQCTSGACCDTSVSPKVFRSSSYVCNTIYSCSSQKIVKVNQYCSGSSSSCVGSSSSPTTYADCSSSYDNLYCSEGTSYSNPTSCSSCSTNCPGVSHGDATCISSGQCGAPMSCDSGYTDCNGNYNDGCETQLGTNSNCDSCGDSCNTGNGYECTNYVCKINCALRPCGQSEGCCPSGCSASGSGSSNQDPDCNCNSGYSCSDGDSCTTDTCLSSGSCSHSTISCGSQTQYRCSSTSCGAAIQYGTASGSCSGGTCSYGTPSSYSTYQTCSSTQTCSGGTSWSTSSRSCVDSGSCCIINDHYKCYNGDVYWYNSCGQIGSLKQDCTSDEICSDDKCITVVSCGDGVVSGNEKCDIDGPNLNGQTCSSQGYTGGTLKCSSDCKSFDTSSCYTCGDGKVTTSGGEKCDINGPVYSPSSLTCSNYYENYGGSTDYTGGSLVCNSNCLTIGTNYCTSCSNDCSSSGAKQCSSSTSYQTCGNYDGDSCLEWSSSSSCSGSTPYCTGSGTCVQCTSPSQCDDGNACTTDSCSGNSCTHSPISGCCTSSSQCDDGNVCTTNTCSSNTCSYPSISGCCTSSSQCTSTPYGACTVASCSSNTCSYSSKTTCTNNDGCCPSGCTYLNDNNCLQCTTNSQCDDSNPCTTDTCSSNTCVHSPISGCCTSASQCSDGNACTSDLCTSNVCSNPAISGCCTSSSQCTSTPYGACTVASCSSNTCSYSSKTTCNNGDGCCPTGCNYLNDNDCIQCTTDSQCNDNNGCTSDKCTNNICSNTNACSSSQTCISGVCTDCVINSASWNPSSGLKNGDSVGLSISTNAACSGKSFTFEIRRDQTIGSELITTKYATGGSSSASTSWDIAITSEGNYFFIASTTGVTSKSSLNTYITIPAAPASCGDGSCNNGETCSTCAQDCPCTSPQVCQSGVCVAPCSLTSASWSTTTTTEGTQVYLNVQGSNCNGKTVYFDVMEKDTLGGDDPVSILPSPVTFNSGTAKGSWIAEWQSEGIPETDPPEYYFDANVDALTIRSSNLLSVNKVSASCGNGLINTGETCDDGNTVNGDGCSAGCLVESGWYCVGEPSDCNPYCPDGSCNNGETCSTCPQDCGACANCGNGLLNAGETCDDANTLSGDGCSGGCLIESGYECDNTPMPSICWKSCGDGTLDAGETCDDGNTYSGDGCSPSCYVEIGWICDNDPMPSVCTEPNVCTISSATWSEDMVEDGDTVYINIQTANCNNGEIINLVVKEDDQSPPLTDDPVIQNPSNVVVNGNMATGSWDAEYQDDTDGNLFNPEENPPEYYFNATIISNGRFHYSDNLLNVVESGALACMGLGSCNDYATQAECEADACSLAQASLPLVTCGLSFDPETRCLSDTSCGCAWDALTSSCSPTWEEELSCGGCGNGVQDYNEQCDDGNTVNGDGCSYECKLEDRPGPCPEGLTLCSDGTCSMNCIFTDEDFASCNYNTACDTGEGCTCADCDGEQDSCEGGLLCSLEDAACCTSVSDGICIRACAFVDPDCDGNELCGNGLRELGEQCDDGNSVSGDGCSAVCLYEVLSPPCPEGLSLCNDGTCSLNCWFTDEGLDDCRDSSCCAEGLSYSIIDLACCNVYSDSICNPYCAYIDPDCGSSGISGILGIGQCIFIKNSNDDCSDGFLTRDYTHQWIWDPTNIFYANPNPSSNNYVESPIGGGEWHYDPLDINGLRRSDRCQDISDELICPAQVKLSFFGKMQFIGAFLLITLIYAIIIFRKKK